ncbi:MAG: AraC family transcriptional regulator [Myxococcota bacterium]
MNRDRSFYALTLQTRSLALLTHFTAQAGAMLRLGGPRPSLVVVSAGSAQARLGRDAWRPTPGEVIALRPGEVLSLDAALPLEGFWLSIAPGPVPVAWAGERPAPGELLEALRAALRESSPERMHRLEAVTAAAARVLRGAEVPGGPLGRVARLALDESIEPPSVADMAAAAGLPPHGLGRRCRCQLGLSPKAFLTTLRLGRAVELLGRGVAPVEVASELDFSDQSHFHRRFVRAFGTTPGAFAQPVGSNLASPNRNARTTASVRLSA